MIHSSKLEFPDFVVTAALKTKGGSLPCDAGTQGQPQSSVVRDAQSVRICTQSQFVLYVELFMKLNADAGASCISMSNKNNKLFG
ncbi:MAG TPA: hypothetical protein VIV60_10645 [Polyangiaceae bacterium]